MTFYIEDGYKHEANFGERTKENAVLVGLIALHAVVTPVVLVADLTKSFPNRISEKAKSLSSHLSEPSIGTINVTEQTVYKLPNQLLSDHVEIAKPENPLISEAHRS
jgi:hypothetical protein